MQEIDDYIAGLRRDHNIGKLIDAQTRTEGTPLRVLLDRVQKDWKKKLRRLLTLPKDDPLFDTTRVELLAMEYLEDQIVDLVRLGDEAHDELLQEHQQANDTGEDV